MFFNDKELWIITLNSTQDRTDYTTDMLKKNNFKYKIFKFFKHKIPWKGCFNSHMFLYKEIIKNDLEYAIIVEDNICISPKYDINNYKQLEQIIEQKNDWDVIIIGGFITPISKCTATEYSRLFRTKNVHGTSSYIISKRGCIKALEYYEKTNKIKHIDIYLSTLNQYIYNPLVFHHRIIPSTINSHLNMIRKIWFNPKMYNLVEFLYFNGRLQITLSLIFFFIILIVFIFIKTISIITR